MTARKERTEINYQLKNIPIDVYAPAKARALRERLTMRDLLIGFLRRYAKREAEPTPEGAPDVQT